MAPRVLLQRYSVMISRRTLLASLVVAGFAAPALAAERIDYSPAAFDAALHSGKPILVWIHASWCPTCKAQAPTLAKLEAEPRFKDLTVVRVDFDSQKDAVKRFGACRARSSPSRPARRPDARSARQT